MTIIRGSMKKFLVVLTILVLVAGFAFADVKGSVTAGYTVSFAAAGEVKDFNVDYGTDDPAFIDATFTLDEQTAPVLGEGSVYVDFAITAKIDGYYSYNILHWNSKTVDTLAFDISIDKFDIVGEGWKLNLLNAKGASADFAKSAVDAWLFNVDKIEEGYGAFTYKNAFDYAPGVTLTVKDFVVGVGLTRDTAESEYVNASVEVKTPEFTFGDVKLQAAAGASQKAPVAADVAYEVIVISTVDEIPAKATNVSYARELGDIWITDLQDVFEDVEEQALGMWYKKTISTGSDLTRRAGGSLKVAYDTDAVKASVAVDAGKVSGKDIDFDIAANLQVKPVTVDVYYASSALAYNPKNAKKTAGPLSKVLSAKVVFSVADIAENVPVTVTVTGKDLLKKNGTYNTLDVEVNTTAIENFDITVTAGDLMDKSELYADLDVKYTGVENLELETDVAYLFEAKFLAVDCSAKYTAEKFTAEAETVLATDFNATIVAFGASVESDKLVNGATLKAAIAGLDFGSNVGDYALAATSLTLSAKVEF